MNCSSGPSALYTVLDPAGIRLGYPPHRIPAGSIQAYTRPVRRCKISPARSTPHPFASPRKTLWLNLRRVGMLFGKRLEGIIIGLFA